VLGSGGEYLEISTFFFRPKNRSGTVRDYTGFLMCAGLYYLFSYKNREMWRHRIYD
jgi:hypothetical protein